MSETLLRASSLLCEYGERELITIDECAVHRGDRIGLIGENGCGKSTLLETLYSGGKHFGTVTRRCEIGFLRQFGDSDASTSEMSGGEAMKLRLADSSLHSADLIFLDEPTSNLDRQGIFLLREFLSARESYILVSHDRALLADMCDIIWLIEDKKLKEYAMGYEQFLIEREKEKREQSRRYENYIDEKRHLEAAMKKRTELSKDIRKTPKRMGNSEARLHKRQVGEVVEKVSNARLAMETRLEKLEKVDKPREEKLIKLDFSLTEPFKNKYPLKVSGLSVSYGQKNVLSGCGFMLENGSRVHLRGENGCGKTTLLRRIYEGDKCVSAAPKVRFGYFAQDLSLIDEDKTVLQNALDGSVQSETVVRTLLSRLLFSPSSLGKSAGALSGGEKVKLSLLKLFVGKVNFLLLDEATNYLDIKSLAVMEEVLACYEGTLIFVSHDERFAEKIRTHTLTLRDGKAELKKVEKPRIDDGSIERTILEMRKAELIARLSSGAGDKEALEREFNALCEKLRNA